MPSLSLDIPMSTTTSLNSWKFLEKIFRNRFEKYNISKYIVSKYIINNHNILLDSGSTIDLVTSELIKSEKKILLLPQTIFMLQCI